MSQLTNNNQLTAMHTLQERPIFHPTNWRPARDEQWEMKEAVLARDGLTDCFWCRQPFTSIDEATLEHILPLADGGRHDLRNCTLACMECNLRNEPRKLAKARSEIQAHKEYQAAINRALNGGELACDDEIISRFPSIARSFGCKPIKYPDAACLLRNIHRQLNRLPPTLSERHVFKDHFNRWLAIWISEQTLAAKAK